MVLLLLLGSLGLQVDVLKDFAFAFIVEATVGKQLLVFVYSCFL